MGWGVIKYAVTREPQRECSRCRLGSSELGDSQPDGSGYAADLPYQAGSWSATEPAKAGWATRLLLWCGGVDRQLLVTRAEVYRYSNLGLLVLAVATLGATSFTLFATVILNHF